jgi:hypothetical protein
VATEEELIGYGKGGAIPANFRLTPQGEVAPVLDWPLRDSSFSQLAGTLSGTRACSFGVLMVPDTPLLFGDLE